MYNFFVNETEKQGNSFIITESDFNHISNVLRMKTGDEILVSCNGQASLCKIEIFSDYIKAEVIEENYHNTNLPIKIHLFQGLPKSDKMELIIQKAVELGVEEITPVEMNRCVVKVEEKKKKSKQERWQSIAESAAKQSKRVVIPKVNNIISYKQFLEKSEDLSVLLVPYENKEGMKATKEALKEIKSGDTVGIIIGPEGGFSEQEIDLAVEKNGKTISLGSRILRTETAAIASVTMCMLYAEMELGEINE
ncbi:MAG: 16S rRNA (uracil(1498)-N(3))-methyltransferase [Clostridia bacterium]|nr:16S rRNA (uracil(1498)-N(3))-methyltransferase [Clostridia bacterium]